MPKKKGPYKSPSQRAKSKNPWSESDRVAKEYFGGHSSKTRRRVRQNTIDEYRKDTKAMFDNKKKKNKKKNKKTTDEGVEIRD